MHRKEECQDLKQAIARGEVHQRDRFTYTGQQGVGDAILVPIPQEVEGRIKWQKEWVQEHMLMKEGNLSHVQTMFVEDSKAGVSCNVVEEAEKINGEPVVYNPSKELEVEVEEKRVRDRGDEGDNNQRTKQLFNPDRPHKILKRGEKSNKENQPKHEKLWNSLRGTVNIDELTKRPLDAPVPGVTVRDLLSILPEMIQQWFGVKRVLPIKEQEAQEEDKLDAMAFTVRWKEALRKLYACASPKCKGRVEETEFEMLIDSEAELRLMSKEVFEDLDLPIDLVVDWSVGAANNQRTKAYGICHDVEVTIGGIVT